jgi:hypothetical protein
VNGGWNQLSSKEGKITPASAKSRHGNRPPNTSILQKVNFLWRLRDGGCILELLSVACDRRTPTNHNPARRLGHKFRLTQLIERKSKHKNSALRFSVRKDPNVKSIKICSRSLCRYHFPRPAYPVIGNRWRLVDTQIEAICYGPVSIK